MLSNIPASSDSILEGEFIEDLDEEFVDDDSGNL